MRISVVSKATKAPKSVSKQEVQKSLLESRLQERTLKQKIEGWVPIVNLGVWRILKVIETHPNLPTRHIHRYVGGSPLSHVKYLRLLREHNFIQRNKGKFRKDYYSLSEKGRKLLRLFDEIGNLLRD